MSMYTSLIQSILSGTVITVILPRLENITWLHTLGTYI